MDLLGTSTVFLVLCLVLLLAWRKVEAKRRNFPPGPMPLPFIGNLLQLTGKNISAQLRKLSEIYGSVFTVYFGSERTVVIYGYSAVKKVLVDNGDDFLNRGSFPSAEKTNKGFGVGMSNGERWVQIRRFSLMTMRNFGMGKKGIEERIQEEAEYLVKELRDRKGQPFNPATLFSGATGNVISHILFGERFDYQDKDFVRILRLLTDSLRLESSIAGQLYNIIPGIMDYLPGAHQQLFKDMLSAKEFIAQKIKDHKNTFDPLNTPRDFIDAFLLKMEQEKTNPTTEFTKDNLIMTVLDLYFAGTETSSTTLRYICMLLLEHPAVEAKIHEEIDRVIGRERPPAMKDRPGMPYTEAVIHEAQRYLDLLPFGILRMAKRDLELEGFTIPKGASIFPMLTSVLHDEKQFKSPFRFDPGHFLDEKGDFKKNGADVPFSAGKRNCLGEGLARMELFLYLTTILQSFHIKYPPGSHQNRPHARLTPRDSSFLSPGAVADGAPMAEAP
ncbi:cytochrome P450 2C19-like isoform X3 [Sceloporus undulatus]|uniref:cytochrome P450 2C19-like isoform X3 n=1 Tax=Sceloporus undulatus TaxID=8520 RepID=UPI001C4D4CCA|nr:cytochrome P450 2C19-like isoform X3 [Sceloporus undulatus]